jgi:hypothetical protein
LDRPVAPRRWVNRDPRPEDAVGVRVVVGAGTAGGIAAVDDAEVPAVDPAEVPAVDDAEVPAVDPAEVPAVDPAVVPAVDAAVVGAGVTPCVVTAGAALLAGTEVPVRSMVGPLR